MAYKDREAQRVYQRDWARKRAAREKLVKDELKSVGCLGCAEKEKCCLAFHHLDPAQKSFTIGRGGGNRRVYVTEEVLRAEAAKCVVLCHNCHAKVHGGILNFGALVQRENATLAA